MQFLTQALVLSAFVSAEVVDVSQFGEALAAFTAEQKSTFESEVDANCGQETTDVEIEKLLNVIAKLKLVDANAEAKTSLASSLGKLQVCQANLITLYDNELENVEKVEEWLALLDDDDLKAQLIAKNVVWLKEEANKTSANQSTFFKTLANKYTDNEVVAGNLVFEIFQALEKFQEREVAQNVLDVIYDGEVTELQTRPSTDLVKGLVDINDFKEIVAKETKEAYETKIEAVATTATTNEAINKFLAIMKDVHVNLINSDSQKPYILEHRLLLNDSGDSSYFLKEVLKASNSESLSRDEVTDFVNRAADLNFVKRRDDNLYNKYQDSMNETGVESDDLKQQKEDAFYTPEKWETLPEEQFSSMKEGLNSDSHKKQQELYGESKIVNIPVQFDFADEPEDATSSSNGTVGKDDAYQFFDNVMDNIRDNSCVNFFKITDDQANTLKESDNQFIKLTKATSEERGCDEIVGKKPVASGVPTIQPFSELCLKGNEEGKPSGIAHYFMHHLGFDNEHQRPDADEFVKHPDDDKVPKLKGRPGQNEKMEEETNSASFLTGTYDIESVMHWASKWTEANEGETITHMRNGSPTVFSTQDYSKINNLYCGGNSIRLQDAVPDCQYMVTMTNTDSFAVKKKCLQEVDADDNDKVNGLADIYFENSTDDQNYQISAKVVYKTEILEEGRRLEGWGDDYAITSVEREGLTNPKCGNAKIYLLNGEDDTQFCSEKDDDEETEILIESECGKPMKLQYTLNNGKKVDGFVPNLSLKDIEYKECAEHTAALLEKASSSIIGLSVLLLTI